MAHKVPVKIVPGNGNRLHRDRLPLLVEKEATAEMPAECLL